MELQPVVFDASTLTLLAKVDLLQLMTQNAKILIPSIVRDEALAKPTMYDARLIARHIDEGLIQISNAIPSAGIQAIQKQFRLAEGEAAALWLAKEKRCVLATDDGPAIRGAKIFGVSFISALHVLIGLFEEGHLDESLAMAKLNSLAVWGRYSGELISQARSKIQQKESD